MGDNAMGLSIAASRDQTSFLNNLQRSGSLIDQATERLATGQQINQGSDDPAGLIGAEHLTRDLVDLEAQTRTIRAARSQVHIGQSGRQIATAALHDIRGQIIEAGSDTTSPEQRQALQQQIDASLDAMDRLGATTGFSIPVALQNLRSGGTANVMDGDVAAAVDLVDEQLTKINQARAAAGAYERYTLDIDQRLAEDQQVLEATARSQLEDADYAQEASNLITGQILNEASMKTLILSQQIERDKISLLFELL
jgi:flagellin